MLFVGCANSDSAVVVTGVVVDGNGLPMSNAKVELAYVSVETDANGYFCFDGMLPPSNFKVKISSINHTVIEKDLPYGNYRIKARLVAGNENGDSVLDVEGVENVASGYNFCQGF